MSVLEGNVGLVFENCAQCGEIECTACFGGYFLGDGECFGEMYYQNIYH